MTAEAPARAAITPVTAARATAISARDPPPPHPSPPAQDGGTVAESGGVHTAGRLMQAPRRKTGGHRHIFAERPAIL